MTLHHLVLSPTLGLLALCCLSSGVNGIHNSPVPRQPITKEIDCSKACSLRQNHSTQCRQAVFSKENSTCLLLMCFNGSECNNISAVDLPTGRVSGLKARRAADGPGQKETRFNLTTSSTAATQPGTTQRFTVNHSPTTETLLPTPPSTSTNTIVHVPTTTPPSTNTTTPPPSTTKTFPPTNTTTAAMPSTTSPKTTSATDVTTSVVSTSTNVKKPAPTSPVAPTSQATSGKASSPTTTTKITSPTSSPTTTTKTPSPTSSPTTTTKTPSPTSSPTTTTKTPSPTSSPTTTTKITSPTSSPTTTTKTPSPTSSPTTTSNPPPSARGAATKMVNTSTNRALVDVVAGELLTAQVVDTGALLAVLVFGLLFFVVTVVLFLTHAYESYRKNEYTKVDYLINGMYAESGL